MNDEQIIKIISDGLLDKNMDMELDDNQIVDIMKAATGHKLQYMMFRYLKKWCANSEWIAQNKRRYIMETFMYKNEFSILPDFFSKLKQNDVQVIGFKGIETCHFLENPYERIMLDVDILVHREDLDKVGEILIGFGYEEAYSDSKIHRTYIHDTFIEIEVHHGLYDSKKREALMGFDQSVWKDTCDFQSHFGEFRIFEIRKNIVYHCVHMTNHFVNGSIDLRQMMDLYYLVNVYIEDNDLMELLEYAASFGLKKYLSVMIFIMYELFELKVDNGFIREMSAEKTYIAKVKHEIVRLRNGDNEYRLDDYRKHLAFYTGKNKSKTKNRLRMIFPRADSMNESYAYIRRHRFLLPVSWIHRIIKILLNGEITFKEKIVVMNNADYYNKINDYLELDDFS